MGVKQNMFLRLCASRKLAAKIRIWIPTKETPRSSGVSPQATPSAQAMHTAMREFSRNSFEVRDRQEGAGQTHQENSKPSSFQKLKPVSLAGKGAETVEQVGEAAGRVADGLTGDNPGKYVTDTLTGKKRDQ
jgi:hypothetical protein